MSTLEDLDALEHEEKKDENKKDGDDQDPKKPGQSGDADMKDADGNKKDEEEEDLIDMDVLNSSTRDIVTRRRLLENDTRIMRSEFQRLTHEKNSMLEKIKDNVDKIDNNRSVIYPLFLVLLFPLRSACFPHSIHRAMSTDTSTYLDNYLIWSAMLLRFSTWTSQKKLLKKVPTSIWTPPV